MELYIGESADVFVFDLTASGDTPPKRDIFGEAGPSIVGVTLDDDRKLFVADNLTNSIIVYAPDVDGNVAPLRAIDIFGLGSLTSVAVDSAGNVYALGSDHGVAIINVYPPGADGHVAPIRAITGIQVGKGTAQSIAIDAEDYLYYVEGPDVRHGALPGPGVVSVYKPGVAGSPKPVRRIEGPSTLLTAATAIDFDGNGDVYVANGDSVLVFSRYADGDEAPLRTIGGNQSGLTKSFALAVDSAGVVYSGTDYPSPDGARVWVFAAGADGNVAPIRVITNLYAHADCMAIDKPRTLPPHKAFIGDGSSVVGDPQRHTVKVTLPGYFDQPIGDIVVGGSGWILRPGQPPIPVPSPGEWGPIDGDTRTAMIGLVLDDLAKHMPDVATREMVRAALLDDVRASVDRLRRSVSETRVAHAEAPVTKARMVDILVRRLGFRGKPR